MKLDLETNVVSFALPENQIDTFTAAWQDAVNAHIGTDDGVPNPSIVLQVNLDKETPFYVEDGKFFLHVIDAEFKAE